MPLEESFPQSMPVITFLLTGVGWPLLAFGLVFSIWGLWNLLRGRGPTSILSQSLLSLLPAVIAMVGIYVACNDFVEMASMARAPKPAEFASAASRGMSFGLCGLPTPKGTPSGIEKIFRALSRTMPVSLGIQRPRAVGQAHDSHVKTALGRGCQIDSCEAKLTSFCGSPLGGNRCNVHIIDWNG